MNPDIYAVVEELIEDSAFDAVTRNPFSQFGPGERTYVGAQILPEMEVEDLKYEETDIRYQTVIAQAQSRYSPPVKKGAGELVGMMDVALGHSGIAREFTGRDFDAVTRMLRRAETPEAATIEAAARILGYVDSEVVRALQEFNEMQRWQAIVNGQVVRVGANGYRELVTYPQPAGHRAAVGGDWTDNAYDPWEDVLGHVEMLADKGYTVSRIVTRRKVINALMRNVNVARRAGGQFIVPVGGEGQRFAEYNGRMTQDFLQGLAGAEGLPAFELYDLRYNRQVGGRAPFLPDGAMVFICETGRDQTVGQDLEPEDQYVLTNTLGYTAVGPVAGDINPGRTIITRTPNEYPPRIEFEGVQASIPVLQDPEAFAVLTGIQTG